MRVPSSPERESQGEEEEEKHDEEEYEDNEVEKAVEYSQKESKRSEGRQRSNTKGSQGSVPMKKSFKASLSPEQRSQGTRPRAGTQESIESIQSGVRNSTKVGQISGASQKSQASRNRAGTIHSQESNKSGLSKKS